MPKWTKLLDFFGKLVQIFPMTPEELDNLYTEHAKQIGHRVFTIDLLKKEIQVFIAKCAELAQIKSQIEAENKAKENV
jgi:hypothetical protein